MAKVVYRVLLTADLHMSNRMPYARPGDHDVTDRLGDQLKLIDEMHAAAEKHSIDAITIIGDLFDQSRVDAVTLTHTVAALTKTKVPIYIIAGNHDANSVRGGRFTVEAFGKMKNDMIHYVDKPFSPIKWLKFWPLPFMPVSVAEKRLAKIREKTKSDQQNVLLFHNSVLGCDHLEWTCDDGLDPDELCEGFDWAIGGHFHTPQNFGKNGLYVGAPMHHHFGDRARDAGYWIAEFSNKDEAEITFKKAKGPRFHVTSKLKIDSDWKNGDYVRVEVEATNAEWSKEMPKVKAFCDGLCDNGIKATFKHKPIYHHKKRLKKTEKKASAVTLDSAISEYVEAGTVSTEGLDKKTLLRIGREILADVRSKHGTV